LTNEKKIIATISIVACVILIIILGIYYGVRESKTEGSAVDFSSLNGYCKNISPITSQEFASRRSCMVSQLQTAGVDAYVTEPGASMLYFSNVTWSLSERAFLLIILRNGSISFISPQFEETRALEQVGNLAPIYTWAEDQNPFELLYTSVLGSPASGFTLAVDPFTRGFVKMGLENVMGSQNSIISGKEVVRQCRMYKSGAEVNILRCANQATKAALKIVQSTVTASTTEPGLKSTMLNALLAAGLKSPWAVVLFAANAAYPHGTSQRLVLKPGDFILIDTGGTLMGYQSDITRTFPYQSNSVNSTQITVWNTVKGAQNAALAAISLGVPCSALDAAARQVVGNAGYGFDYEYFTHRVGHGIGMEGHEEAYMVRGNDNVTLAPGMAFSVEPGIYIQGSMGVRIEDIAVITSTPPYYEVFGPLSESIYYPIP